MTDFRFKDIVETNSLIGPKGRHYKSTCLSCSTQYKVVREDFEVEITNGNSTYIPRSVTQDLLEYVSKMRAWNCCYEDEVPIDGLPDEVESPVQINLE